MYGAPCSNRWLYHMHQDDKSAQLIADYKCKKFMKTIVSMLSWEWFSGIKLKRQCHQIQGEIITAGCILWMCLTKDVNIFKHGPFSLWSTRSSIVLDIFFIFSLLKSNREMTSTITRNVSALFPWKAREKLSVCIKFTPSLIAAVHVLLPEIQCLVR